MTVGLSHGSHSRERLTAAKRVEPAREIEALAIVETLLERLRARLDEGLSWELKRQLIEVLVDSITVDTIETGTKREAVINVRYKFVSSVDTRTDMGSWPRSA